MKKVTQPRVLDSIVVGISVAYTDNFTYKSYIDNSQNELLTCVLKNLALHGSPNLFCIYKIPL